jgi:hypothetical protein
MTQEEKLADLNTRVQELQAKAKELEIREFAVQQVRDGGYIENVVMYRDLKQYPEEVEVKEEETKE